MLQKELLFVQVCLFEISQETKRSSKHKLKGKLKQKKFERGNESTRSRNDKSCVEVRAPDEKLGAKRRERERKKQVKMTNCLLKLWRFPSATRWLRPKLELIGL